MGEHLPVLPGQADMRELWKPVAAIVICLFLAVQAMLSFTSWQAAWDSLSWLPWIVGGVVLGPKLLRLLAASGSAASARMRTVRVNIEPHGKGSAALRAAAIHEAGHAEGARSVGGRVVDARIYPDGSGWCETRIPYTPHNRIVTAYAGQIAEGSDVGAGHDNKTIKRVLATVPSSARGAVWVGAKKATHTAVSSGRGRINRDAARLLERRRW